MKKEKTVARRPERKQRTKMPAWLSIILVLTLAGGFFYVSKGQKDVPNIKTSPVVTSSVVFKKGVSQTLGFEGAVEIRSFLGEGRESSLWGVGSFELNGQSYNVFSLTDSFFSGGDLPQDPYGLLAPLATPRLCSSLGRCGDLVTEENFVVPKGSEQSLKLVYEVKFKYCDFHEEGGDHFDCSVEALDYSLFVDSEGTVTLRYKITDLEKFRDGRFLLKLVVALEKLGVPRKVSTEIISNNLNPEKVYEFTFSPRSAKERSRELEATAFGSR